MPRYPHVVECTLPLRVLALAVACTMRNEALRVVTVRYGSVADRYGTLWERDRPYGTLTENIDFAHH